ncbi:hypothetical protein [Parahaliea mediterranea]|uniref:Uncharacterized protein n=1 Tax=Parahaliea mediterranea TaxID=651086 RepID=A0A939IJ80_9GAMM|nr:hypothetical protein [Parahaliea mediterranea]MBN7796006.1 hypothetical protein [Parahaliea mediterranea]
MQGLRVIPLLTALALPATAPAADPPEKTCQRLKDAIERYTDKRRAGGSPQQMDSWKRARQDKKNEWDRLKCRRISARLE